MNFDRVALYLGVEGVELFFELGFGKKLMKL